MKKLLLNPFVFLLFMFLSYSSINGQARFVINGAYVNVNGGTSATPVYLVVENTNNNAITRNTGHIISGSEYNFVKWNIDTFQRAYIFPFGYATTDYIPFTYDKVDNAPVKLSFSTWSTNVDNNPHPDNVAHMNGTGDSITSAIDRFWTMQATGPSQGYFTFSYRGAENTTTNPTTSNFSAQYWGSGDWSSQPPGGSVGVTAGVGNTTLPFSMTAGQFPYVLTRTGFALPVDLLDFNTKWENGEKLNASLKWQTATEINLSNFEIQRSVSGKDFKTIATVQAKGNSQSTVNYSLLDTLNTELGNTFFYRLKMNDYDGSSKLSNMCFIERSTIPVLAHVDVYPNPFQTKLMIDLQGFKGEVGAFIITDALGKVVHTTNILMQSNRQLQIINLPDLAMGSYCLRTEIGTEIKMFKLIKNR